MADNHPNQRPCSARPPTPVAQAIASCSTQNLLYHSTSNQHTFAISNNRPPAPRTPLDLSASMSPIFSRAAPRAFNTALAAAVLQRPTAAAARTTRLAAPALRRALATPASEQPRIRLGTTGMPSPLFTPTASRPPARTDMAAAPNFQAKTTHGDIDFHSYINGSWAILFSHPADFTPVCTTELGAFSRLRNEFAARGVKMLGLSANDLSSHDKWIADINDIGKTTLDFPIIADADRRVAWLYDMLDAQDLENIDEKGIAFTIRSVFVIDPAKKVRLTMMYPASTGRNTKEVLRVIDSLQTGDRRGVTTPIDWVPGDEAIVPPSVKTEDARKKFGEVREVRPYLRFVDIGDGK